MAFNGTRATPYWRVMYPKIHFEDQTKPLHSIIIINANVPTDQYKQIQFKSADVSGVYLRTEERNFIVINIYNNCNNNDPIDVVREFLLTKYPDEYIPIDTHVIIGSDFNHHHPWWETNENEYLTLSEHMICLLLDLTTNFDLHMALPPHIPTLQAFSTGNWTRPDNVWCSSHSADLLIQCDTDPQTHGPNTDHVPIHIVLDTSLPHNTAKATCNFRIVDWEKFNEHLMIELGRTLELGQITTHMEFRTALDNVNSAIKWTVEAQVPLNKPLPHTKRWWTPKLSAIRKKKNSLAGLSYKWRGLPDHHSHGDHRRMVSEYARLIDSTKKVSGPLTP